jgi:hypothetical protein
MWENVDYPDKLTHLREAGAGRRFLSCWLKKIKRHLNNMKDLIRHYWL